MAGISYQIRGSGPPLVLLPLGFAPSQWEPLLPTLSKRYCTITLGGAELGVAPFLENRGRAPGYLRMVRTLMDEVQLQPGETILDVGCGTGVLNRWLARRTGGANPIIAVDINRSFLREATALARKEGLEGTIEFREGSEEALPFPDQSFEVTMSATVMEEVDADRMLAEMVRVTKPGGSVAVIVRAVDMPFWVNIPIRTELKTNVEAAGVIDRNVGERGCADASLYRRFHEAGLTEVTMFPQLVSYDDSAAAGRDFFHNEIRALLPTLFSPEEVKEWHMAIAQAEAEGTFCIGRSFHCAVGTKP